MWRALVVIGVTSIVSFGAAQSISTRPKPKNSTVPHRQLDVPSFVDGPGQTTASGVRFWDLKAGSGDLVKKGQVVKLHYKVWTESGTKLASSVDVGQPIIFVLAPGKVMKGWEEGIEGMRVSGKRQLRFPSALASLSPVPGIAGSGEALIYDIEILGAH